MSPPPNKNPFSLYEDLQIVKYLIEKRGFMHIGGNKIWQLMEDAKICPSRTFHSLRNRFLKNICHRLWNDYGNLLDKAERLEFPKRLQKDTRQKTRPVPSVSSSSNPSNSNTPFLPSRAVLAVTESKKEKNVAYRNLATEEPLSAPATRRTPAKITEELDDSGWISPKLRPLQSPQADKENLQTQNDGRMESEDFIFPSQQWEAIRRDLFNGRRAPASHSSQENTPSPKKPVSTPERTESEVSPSRILRSQSRQSKMSSEISPEEADRVSSPEKRNQGSSPEETHRGSSRSNAASTSELGNDSIEEPSGSQASVSLLTVRRMLTPGKSDSNERPGKKLALHRACCLRLKGVIRQSRLIIHRARIISKNNRRLRARVKQLMEENKCLLSRIPA